MRNGVAVKPATIAPFDWKCVSISTTASLHIMCASSTITSWKSSNLS
jgi:hypothetical protein